MRPSSLVLVTSALAACASQPGSAAPACEPAELVVVASDYSSSAVGGVPGPALATGVDLGKSVQLSASNGRFFCLAQFNDLVFELDGSCGTPRSKLSVHELAGTKEIANPHDVAAAPDGTVWVTLYNVGRIALGKDGKVTGSIDLSSYDPDGNPQVESVRIVDVAGTPKAFVALERLDDNDFPKSKQPSQMLRIDVATRAVEAVVQLAGRNPFNPMAEVDGALFLSEPGNFDSADEDTAGIERFDTKTSTTKLLVPENRLAGSVAYLAVTKGCGAAIVAGPQKDVNPTHVVLFDPDTGEVKDTVMPPTAGYDLQGLAWRGDVLYVGDRRRGPGGYPIHAFARDGNACSVHPSTERDLVLPGLPPVALRTTG